MKLRPFRPSDAPTILSWCKDKHTFRLWSADRYRHFPARPEEMVQQYDGLRMYPLTAVVGAQTVGHILLRHPTDDKSVVRFGFVIVDTSHGKRGNQIVTDLQGAVVKVSPAFLTPMTLCNVVQDSLLSI